MDVFHAVGAVSQGIRLVKGLIPKQSNLAEKSQQSFGEVMLQHQDSNGDGALSAKELKLSTALFGRLDRDSDGILSIDELNAGAQMIQNEYKSDTRINQYIESHDADHNSLISTMESGLDSGIFLAADHNNDKQLNRSEIATAFQNRSMDLST